MFKSFLVLLSVFIRLKTIINEKKFNYGPCVCMSGSGSLQIALKLKNDYNACHLQTFLA